MPVSNGAFPTVPPFAQTQQAILKKAQRITEEPKTAVRIGLPAQQGISLAQTLQTTKTVANLASNQTTN